MSSPTNFTFADRDLVIDPDCTGRPDCPPTTWYKHLTSIVIVGGIFFVTDSTVYSTVGDHLKSPNAKETPDFGVLVIAYLLAGILFSVIYTYYARFPRSFHNHNTPAVTRMKKGAIYGLLIGCIVFIPAAFFEYSLMQDANLGNLITDAAYHLVQFVIAGIAVALIQGENPRQAQ